MLDTACVGSHFFTNKIQEEQERVEGKKEKQPTNTISADPVVLGSLVSCSWLAGDAFSSPL